MALFLFGGFPITYDLNDDSGDGDGGSQKAYILQVDYSYKTDATSTPPVYVDMTSDTYEQAKVYFTIEGTVNGTLAFNMKDEPNSDGKVYYTANSSLTNKLSSPNSDVASNGSDTSLFPKRETEQEIIE